ncbi:Serine/threonine protein kinase [Parasponia andersonii]|uniref:Serine/threonine protein kinase n=1 Tax=Parasponia andersonii TaxID=3476 RepID=A0A2P5AE77_PARAD|nr:Serine/threonine protein kinase [Parasponia andersonii]
MAIYPESQVPTSLHDPLLPWLWYSLSLSEIHQFMLRLANFINVVKSRSIRKALEDLKSDNDSGLDLSKLVSDCIKMFKDNAQYRDDIRFLKIWFLHIGFCKDFGSIFTEMLEKKICVGQSLLYVWYASYIESKGKLYDAQMVYQMGILRNAEPVEWLKKAQALFLDRMSELVNSSSLEKVDGGESIQSEESHINPWSSSTMKNLLRRTNTQITKYDGCRSSNKPYSGKLALSSQNLSRNKIIEIGGRKYQIKGRAGQGGFAQVYKACLISNPDEIVALKIQKPPFPWEFYMYRQLDQRILAEDRSSFGFAERMHLYSDCSVLVCDYLANGTLQDTINSYVVTGKSMEEVLCIYYTIEMLYMLETLHGAGIIHGDFKPDNLLIRYASVLRVRFLVTTITRPFGRDDLVGDGLRDRSGSWRDQGLCLVDWGRGIDLRLFPDDIEFKGDCRTSGFRCIEMQQNKSWKFQVDTYGLCVIVHMMLHNCYMEIQEKPSPDGGYIYLPKSPFKRYWNVDLWKNFFTKLLNNCPGSNDKNLLQDLRESFQGYMCSNPQLIKKLKELLLKQRASFVELPKVSSWSISSPFSIPKLAGKAGTSSSINHNGTVKISLLEWPVMVDSDEWRRTRGGGRLGFKWSFRPQPAFALSGHNREHGPHLPRFIALTRKNRQYGPTGGYVIENSGVQHPDLHLNWQSRLPPHVEAPSKKGAANRGPVRPLSYYVADVVSEIAAAPFNNIKLLIQNQNEMLKQGRGFEPYRGSYQCFARTVRVEGHFSLWRGNTDNITGSVTSKALEVSLNDYLQRSFSKLKRDNAKNLESFFKWVGWKAAANSVAAVPPLLFVYPLGLRIWLMILRHLLILVVPWTLPIKMVDNSYNRLTVRYGVLAAGGLAYHPFDTKRRRMMMTSGEAFKYNNSWDAFIQVIEHEGANSLFKGFAAAFLHSFVISVVLFGYVALMHRKEERS